MDFETVKVGLIGCGIIGESYMRTARNSRIAVVKAVADIRPEAAALYERTYDVTALATEDLLSDPEIEIVLNFTQPQQHLDVSRKIIAAGKHVYTEKPLAAHFAEAHALVTEAQESGVRIASAPDTFLGAAHQAARRAVDSGAIGAVAGGIASWLTRGSAHRHAKPSFFVFKQGGGPHLDMGVYYVTQLVNLLGPVKRVTAITSNPFPDREVIQGPLKGTKLTISEVPTTVNGIMEFHSGANVVVSLSWDVYAHGRQHLEIYGEKGSLYDADPNYFGGEVWIAGQNKSRSPVAIDDFPFAKPNRTGGSGAPIADHRYAGVIDLAAAIRNNRPHRASGDLALHVLEVLEGFVTSSQEERHITLATTCRRPLPMPMGEGEEALARDFAPHDS